MIHGFFSHLEIDWELPASRYVNERLGSFARLIRFDKRGTGLSDRNVGLPDLESRMDDVRAVMDAVGSESAAVFGYSEGGPLAVLFAATYPERVRALVLYGSYAKRRDPDDDYPWAPTWDERLEVARELEETWGSNVDLGSMWPDPDEVEAAWFHRRGARLAEPCRRTRPHPHELAGRRAGRPADDPVPDARGPPHGDRDARLDEGRYIAGRIPGARFVELPGDDHTLVADPRAVLDEVEEFLTGITAEAVDRPCPRDHPLHRSRRLHPEGDGAR